MRQITVRLDDDTFGRLAVRAEMERRPTATLAALLIADGLGVVPELPKKSGPPPAPSHSSAPPVAAKCPLVVPRGVKCKSCGKVH